MEKPEGQAAPESGTSEPSALTHDAEILALIDFDPVPRKREVDGAWTPELQREFIVRLAITGSPGRAAEEMGKTDTGVRKLYRTPEGVSFAPRGMLPSTLPSAARPRGQERNGPSRRAAGRRRWTIGESIRTQPMLRIRSRRNATTSPPRSRSSSSSSTSPASS